MARIKIRLPERFIFSTELRVRIGDINYGGHLGNDTVLSMAQEARVRLLKRYGFTEGDIEGLGLIMMDAAVVYRTEAFHGDLLVIELAVEDIHKHGCDFLYRITNKETGREIARVKTGIVFFDYVNRKISKTPERFASIFASAGSGQPLKKDTIP